MTTTDTHVHSSLCFWAPDHARWVCPSAPTRPLVDVRDMLVVHQALLREFRLAPAAVERVEPGVVARARVVDQHLGFLCDLLHHHHEGEDELLWPLLRDRVTAARLRSIEAVEEQHEQIDAALHTVRDARTAWVADAGADERSALAGALGELHELLAAHLALEESEVLPVAARMLTDAEWHAVGDAAAAALPKPELVLAFGMFAYEGDPEVLRTMLASAPAVPRVLVPRIAPRAYARRARRVHGTARP